MTISITVSKSVLLVTGLTVFLLLGAVSLVFADHDPNMVHACVKNGSIVIVAAEGDCKTSEEAFTLATEGAISALEAQNAALQAEIDSLEMRMSDVEDLLVHFARNGSDVIISGANLHVVNGLNDTQSTNGLGNVIIGYNELRNSGNDRTGSHMLVVGKELNYSSFGGVVVGFHNETSGGFSSVSGGHFNIASGPQASVSGGQSNEASGDSSSVSGGQANMASGIRSSVTAGDANEASGSEASVTGGNENKATGNAATVSGGFNRSALGTDSWAAGSLFESN
jgi:hypothetical protein